MIVPSTVPSSATATTRRAFTLIELLMVIAVIAVLSAVLFPLINMLRDQARAAVTRVRIDETQRALGQVAGDTSPALTLHRWLQGADPSLARGVLDFEKRTAQTRAVLGTANTRDEYGLKEAWFPKSGQDWIRPPWKVWEFQHPWGTDPTDLPGDAPTTLPPAGAPPAIESHRLADLCPRLSQDLLTQAGILGAGDQLQGYRSQRSPGKTWNDGWGRPLVVAFAIYQPRCNTALGAQENQIHAGWDNSQDYKLIRPDLFLTRANKAYGFSRAVYLSTGAIGKTLLAPLDDDVIANAAGDWTSATGTLTTLWRQINAVANTADNGDELWRTDGTVTPIRNPFNNAPWDGISSRKRGRQRCFIAAPTIVR